MHDPLVSVLLRVHEAYAEFLPRAWKSVLGQTVPRSDFELFVVVDGSPDECPRIREFEESVGQPDGLVGGFTYTPQRTGYFAIPCNMVIPWSSAPWIAFLDADNEWEPNHLEVLLRAVAGSQRPALAYTRRRYVREDQGLLPSGLPEGPSPLVPWTPENVRRLFLGPTHNFVDSGDMIVSKGALFRLNYRDGHVFNPEMMRFGDWDLVVRLATLDGLAGAAVDAATNIYHWHGCNLQLTRRWEPVQLPKPPSNLPPLDDAEGGTGR